MLKTDCIACIYYNLFSIRHCQLTQYCFAEQFLWRSLVGLANSSSRASRSFHLIVLRWRKPRSVARFKKKMSVPLAFQTRGARHNHRSTVIFVPGWFFFLVLYSTFIDQQNNVRRRATLSNKVQRWNAPRGFMIQDLRRIHHKNEQLCKC